MCNIVQNHCFRNTNDFWVNVIVLGAKDFQISEIGCNNKVIWAHVFFIHWKELLFAMFSNRSRATELGRLKLMQVLNHSISTWRFSAVMRIKRKILKHFISFSADKVIRKAKLNYRSEQSKVTGLCLGVLDARWTRRHNRLLLAFLSHHHRSTLLAILLRSWDSRVRMVRRLNSIKEIIRKKYERRILTLISMLWQLWSKSRRSKTRKLSLAIVSTLKKAKGNCFFYFAAFCMQCKTVRIRMMTMCITRDRRMCLEFITEWRWLASKTSFCYHQAEEKKAQTLIARTQKALQNWKDTVDREKRYKFCEGRLSKHRMIRRNLILIRTWYQYMNSSSRREFRLTSLASRICYEFLKAAVSFWNSTARRKLIHKVSVLSCLAYRKFQTP